MSPSAAARIETTAPETPDAERPPESGAEGATTLVRATCRIQLDLADLIDDETARDAHRRRKCGGVGQCVACDASKRLRDVRRDCARIANISMRLREAADADLLDRFMVAEGRPPKGAEWTQTDLTGPIERVTAGMPKAERALLLAQCKRVSGSGKAYLYPYPLLCRMAPAVSAGIVSMVDQAMMQKWSESRWASLVMMNKARPHISWTNPIPLRKADVQLQHVAGKRYRLSFSVSSRDPGRRGKEFSIPVIARDEYLSGILQTLASDSSRMGALQISEDNKRPGRWYVRIAYRKVAAKSTATKAAAINKGMVFFLAAVTESGSRWMQDGADISAYLKQVQSRRQRYQRQVKASSRGGHGRTRTLRPIEHLQGKGEAWRETRCQTIARRFVGWLVTEGVGRLYIDDFSGIRDQPPETLWQGEWIWKKIQEWPYYKLQTKIISCCEEVGIECVVRTPKHISGTCPKCGSRECEFRNRKLLCRECKHSVHWDIGAAQINLRDGERERMGDAGELSDDPVPKRRGKKSKTGGARKPSSKPAGSGGDSNTGANE